MCELVKEGKEDVFGLLPQLRWFPESNKIDYSLSVFSLLNCFIVSVHPFVQNAFVYLPPILLVYYIARSGLQVFYYSDG